MAAGGCVALNPGFEDSGAGTGGAESSDTGQRTAGESDSDSSAGKGTSAVTTVTAGESSGSGTMDPTDSSGVPGSESGHADGSSVTSLGESGDSGVDCTPDTTTVTEDAFLQTCFDAECGYRNYGQAERGSLSDGEDAGALLLRVPNPSLEADQIEVTVHLVVEDGFEWETVTLTAYPINSPCEWEEGPSAGLFLEPGVAGVTFHDCNGDPDGAVGWTLGEEGTVWDNIDPGWDSGEFSFEGADVTAGEVFAATLTLDSRVAAPTPDAIVIEADIPFLDELFVFSAEDELDPPVVTVWPLCR